MSGAAEHYRGYADLANAQIEGTDYRVHVRPVAHSSVAVIAPHGGSIEQYTSEIALSVAGHDFNLYHFEGIRRSGNYAALHLTSHRFDEPRCLALLSKCDHVVAVHGCGGETQKVLIGGRDESLKAEIARAISDLGVDTQVADHPFPATDSMNICNRGRSGAGVQIELTMPFRLHGPRDALAGAIRSVLLALPDPLEAGGRSR
ncbi:poly-gamma-glutamate hydrolase family protein [Acidovorax sp. SUPP3434]|uniref:poly-gamma-glutamate hydrolase family protein n=1 Tax=Acidovorax sp. SUPP3434 TaxID=2920880 RepID=UPI0023DE4CE3|nr:poly-gamma-glutamate hydrolase family protein [Acidovorax sp. SUPP3434]GKT00503.1 poly-gamma-glutamate hydrolase family protein [Acidovorax sp. SUPP3434]